MGGTKLIFNFAVILRALIGVFDHHTMEVPVVLPSNTPENNSTKSSSRRWVV